MTNRVFGSLNKTIVNSSDYVSKKKQMALYGDAKRDTSRFGVATNDNGGQVVVTARNYEDLLNLTKGFHHELCDSSGADTLKYDIWSGNKMQVTYGNHIPIRYTGNLDVSSTLERPGDDNIVPYPATINSGYPGYTVDPCGTLFGRGELGDGPDWVNNVADVSYADTSDYKRGSKSQPLDNFFFPRRVTLY